MDLNFLILDKWILQRQDISATAKMITAVIWNFKKRSLPCYVSIEWLSSNLGIVEDIIWIAVEELEQKGIARRVGTEWMLDISEEINENQAIAINRRSERKIRSSRIQ